MDSEFNVWPWFWGAVLVWVGLAITRPPGFTAFTIGAGLAALSALVLLIIGIVNPVKQRRNAK